MKTFFLSIAFFLSTAVLFAQNIWVNEIHYDNAGTDAGEFIEVVLENATTYNLSDFTIVLYNGNGGTSYGSQTLDNFTLVGNNGNFSFFTWYPSQIQNGSPDGVAIGYQGALVQFLSYEGSFEATEGVATGTTSTDILVSEDNSPIGESLQLMGTGSAYTDFTWTGPTTESPGSINTGQTFNAIVTPIISFEMASQNVAETDGMVTLTVNIQNMGATPSSVEVVLSGGTATNSEDIESFTTTLLTFDGTTTQSINLSLINDDQSEGTETLEFSLQNPTGDAQIGLPATHTVIIADDDFVAPNLIISEIMQNPSGTESDQEWFEVFNNETSAIDLQNWTIRDDGSDSHTITGSLIIQPQSFAVFCRNGDSTLNGDFPCDYVYGNDIFLSNSEDEVVLVHSDGTTIVDQVSYNSTSFPVAPNGASMAFTGFAFEDNNDGTFWSISTIRELNFNGVEGDFGSPGTNGIAQQLILPEITIVQFTQTEATLSESEGMVSLTVEILNPEATVPTSVEVALSSGTATNGDDISLFETTTLTFEGDTPTPQTVSIIIADDQLEEFSETLIFTLQNPSGGNMVALGDNTTFTLTLLDNDAQTHDLLITEFLSNASGDDTNKEWIELYNNEEQDLDIFGYILKDDASDSHTIATSLIVPAKDFIVLCQNADTTLNGDLNCDYAYGSDITLSNTSDEIVLLHFNGIDEIDRIAYDDGLTFPNPNGASTVFTGTPNQDNNDGTLWATASYREPNYNGTEGDFGSPGTNGVQQNLNPLAVTTVEFVYPDSYANGYLAVQEDVGTIAIEVRITNPNPTLPTTLNASFGSGTATNGSDLENFPNQQIVFDNPAVLSKEIMVTILDDTESEGAEYFNLNLLDISGGTNAILLNNNFKIVIFDDDFDAPQLMIAEIMVNPSGDDTNKEWFEIFNASTSQYDLAGYQFRTSTQSTTPIATSLLIEPNTFLVFCQNGDELLNGGLKCDYVYDNTFVLENASDKLTLIYRDEFTILDEVPYDDGTTFPNAEGASMIFAGNTFDDNSLGSNWKNAPAREPRYIGENGDLGSPGFTGQEQSLPGPSPVSSEKIEQPYTYSLSEAYPNPFNPATNFLLELEQPQLVTMTIYNALGQKVSELTELQLSAGKQTVTFDASHLPSGLYFVNITGNDFAFIRKAMLLK